MQILAEQAAMPASTAIGERLVAIARHCPALHKLGQVIARDRRLPAGLRRLLQNLESTPSTMNVAGARRLAEAELGRLSDIGIDIDEPPLAEASVAIVVPFRWRRNSGEVSDGVLKLLKPGIESKLEEELDLLQRIGALLDERCEAYQLPRIDYEDAFIQVKTLLSREVCLDREQGHMRAAREAFTGWELDRRAGGVRLLDIAADGHAENQGEQGDRCGLPVGGGQAHTGERHGQGAGGAADLVEGIAKFFPRRSARRQLVRHPGGSAGNPRLEPGRPSYKARSRSAHTDPDGRADP